MRRRGEKHRWIGILALACGLLAGARAAAAGAEGATVEARAREAARRGLDWLKSVQKQNGSWSNENYPAMTALGLWAFARSGHPDRAEVGEAAARFVAGFAREDGGIYKPASGGRGSGGLSTYNTALSMIALHAWDSTAYAPILLKARAFMADSQIAGDSDGAGGFGYNRDPPGGLRGLILRFSGRNRADLSNTGWAVQAMRVTQDLEDLRPGNETVDIDWGAALQYLDRLQNKDRGDKVNYGGFAYEGGGARGGTSVHSRDGTVTLLGYGSMTYAGLESLIYAQVDRTDPRVQSALSWAARHWSVEQNPGRGRKGLYYYYNIMAKALSLSGRDRLTPPDGDAAIPWKQELIDKLVELQSPDGRWVNEDNQFWEGDPVLVTSYAVLALQYGAGTRSAEQ